MRYLGNPLQSAITQDLVDQLTFNGSDTIFNLTIDSSAITVTKASQLIVSLNGVIQEPETDYNVINNGQIEFTNPPVASDDHFIVFVPNTSYTTQNIATIISSNTTSFNTTVTIPDLNISGNTSIAGNLAVSGSISQSSSILLKEDIQPLEMSLDIISKLQGVSYKRTATGEHEVGLIAEKVEEILPFLVKGSGKNKTLMYTNIIAYLVESIKELKDQIDILKQGKDN